MVAACTLTPAPSGSFRQADKAIYSSAVLDPSRLSGHWVQTATFAPGGQPACAPGLVNIDAAQLRWDLCLPGGRQSGAGPLIMGQPGRFAVAGMADWWVLWADGDYRTLLIGTPSGEFGFVLNRDATLPSDRLKAVRDIANFNGYRIEMLAVF